MIVTLTVNPSLDRTVQLDGELARGAVQRALETREDPGGKGVNVTRALRASGVDSLAVLPGATSDPFFSALRAEDVPFGAVSIEGRIRANLTLTEVDGTTTKINEPGPTLAEKDQDALITLVAEVSEGADWLVLAGSLPPGVPDDFYARVVRAVREANARPPRIAVDSSGAPLRALVAARVAVDLIKPNAEELAELVGVEAGDDLEDDPEAALALARSLDRDGVVAALVTLGATGAVLSTDDGAWFAPAPRILPRSTVGAGDCSLAGYLVAAVEGERPDRCLARAVASGAAAASLPGSIVPTRDQVDAAAIEPVALDPNPLEDPESIHLRDGADAAQH
ncbi:1-phosphofructokinase family hexose kinase [Glaciibacter flavus]|uniref:1-phosphofructokinase family hexose kinase n=1 Tax=Orlajensenia flava TaxID=2565934 RepID=UPI003B0023A4